jgi:hypothetical protein
MINRLSFISFCFIFLKACPGDFPPPFTNEGCLLGSTKAKETGSSYKINLFFETSGSMAGFMPQQGKKSTEFQNDMWSLISNLSRGFPSKFSISQLRAKKDPGISFDANEFRYKMNRGEFQLQTSTDIPEMLDTALSKVNSSTISILISDLIFSPENGSPASYPQITTDIKNRFAGKNLSSALFLFTSQFYSKVNVLSSPYYVWIFGPEAGVRKVSDNIRENFNGIKELSYGLQYATPEYSIAPYSTGVTKATPLKCLTSNRYFTWTDYEEDESNKMEFYLALNLSQLPNFSKDCEYLKDNLSPSTKSLEIISIENYKQQLKSSLDNQVADDLHATHLIKVRTQNILEEDEVININLINKSPIWPASIDTTADDKSRHKTFGLLQMLKGLDHSFKQPKFLFKEPISILITKKSN